MPRVVPSEVVKVMESLLPPFLASDNESHEGPNARQAMPSSNMGQLEAVLALIEQVPEELITLNGHEYTDLTASIAAIRSILKRWVMDNRPDLRPIPGLSDLNPVVVIHHGLAHCPDQFPSPETAELSFLQPDDLRENLRLDISGTNRALSNGEWKAATVLAGSIVEALLLWALQQLDPLKRAAAISASGKSFQQPPPENLDWWTLHQFIEVAVEGDVIESDTAVQARLAKDYRNLIHPGCASRLGQVCDRGTALSAVAAVELVVRDLTP